jgi:hypothetical protein
LCILWAKRSQTANAAEDNFIGFSHKKQHNRTLSLQETAYLRNKFENNTNDTNNLHKRQNTTKAQNGDL